MTDRTSADRPLTIWVEATQHCQIKCRYCYNGWRAEAPSAHRQMSRETVQAAADFARSRLTSYDVTTVLAGGDLTAHPDWLEIVDAFAPVGPVNVVTHGQTLGLDDLERLAERAVEIQFSIPSLDPARYRFLTGGGALEPVLRNVERARFLGIPVSLSAVVTRTNTQDVTDLIRCADEIAARYIVFNQFLPVGRGALYEERFSLAYEAFVETVVAARRMAGGSTRVLIGGALPDVRDEKVRAPKLTVTVDGQIAICSGASSTIGSVAEGEEVIDRYLAFWRGAGTIAGCSCSEARPVPA